MNWIESTKDGLRLAIRLVPRASRNEVRGQIDGRLKIRLQAPPVKGKANKALIEFLSDRLGVRKKDIRIVAGETTRDKHIVVRGLDKKTAERSLRSKT